MRFLILFNCIHINETSVTGFEMTGVRLLFLRTSFRAQGEISLIADSMSTMRFLILFNDVHINETSVTGFEMTGVRLIFLRTAFRVQGEISLY